jgi:hypothetical protein
VAEIRRIRDDAKTLAEDANAAHRTDVLEMVEADRGRAGGGARSK